MQHMSCSAPALQAQALSSGRLLAALLPSPKQRLRSEVPAGRQRRPGLDVVSRAATRPGAAAQDVAGSNGTSSTALPAATQHVRPSQHGEDTRQQDGQGQAQGRPHSASAASPLLVQRQQQQGPQQTAAGPPAFPARTQQRARPPPGGSAAPSVPSSPAPGLPPMGLPPQGPAAAAAAAPSTQLGAGGGGGSAPAGDSTQLIFRFERRGDGWAEEILPHLVVEQRPLERRKKRAYSRPDPWQPGSLECYLVELGVPSKDVDRVVTQAVAWRVTPGGRSLIDRRRRSRVERNVRLVVEHLELECQVPFGANGVAAILARCPEIMLCKPTTNDRWDRRAVELSAYLLRNGHCNVPEDWSENPELGLWVKRQRIARAAGQLSDERLSILQSMGFAFGEVAQLTEDWEHRFDQLVDWMLWHNENHQPFSWLGVDWGARGGITARELALWTTLQREYRARGLLPGEALSRFEAIGVQWDSATDGTPAERVWMSWFGRLLYLIERHNTLLQQPRRSQLLNGRPKMGRPRGAVGRGAAGGGSGSDAEDPSGLASAAATSSADGVDLADSDDEEAEPPLGFGGSRRGGVAVAAARLRLQEEMAARRAALAAADLRSEPGLRFWLERQRRRWRRQELPAELALILQLAGVQLDTYCPSEWQAMAHKAAEVLQGCQITVDLAGAAQQAQQGMGRPAPASSSSAASAAAAAGDRRQGGAAAAVHPRRSRHEREQQPACPPGITRMRVARWVQTQQALFAEGKLSAAQLRYLAFLDLTWFLSEEVTQMVPGTWRQWHERLAASPRPPPRHGELWQWLEHQKGLHALGWLPAKRRIQLEELQVQLEGFDRCPEDAEWDRRLSDLLAYKAEHGHVRVPPPSPDAAHPRWASLAGWLAEVRRAAAERRLPPPRTAQLAALGALQPALPPAAGRADRPVHAAQGAVR